MGSSYPYYLAIPKLSGKDSYGNSTLDIRPLILFKEKIDKSNEEQF